MRKPTLKEILKQHNLTGKDAIPPFTDVPISVRQAITHEEPLLWWHALAILQTINKLLEAAYTLNDISTSILFPDLTERWGYTETVPREKPTVAEIFFFHHLDPKRLAFAARLEEYEVQSLIHSDLLARWKVEVLFEEMSKEIGKPLTSNDVYGIRFWENSDEKPSLREVLKQHALHPGLIAFQANHSPW